MKKAGMQQIDGKKYEIFQLAPKESLRILTKIIRIVGGPVGISLASMKGIKNLKDLLDSDVGSDLIGSLISTLAGRLDEKDVLDICETLLNNVSCDGVLIQQMEHPNFQGKPFHLLKVVKSALEVNYSDFLQGNSALGSLIKKAPMTRDLQP